MSINLVDLVMKQVGGNIPGILGSLLGESADNTTNALSGAVPAILGSLMGVASKGGQGAEQLVAAVSDQDDSMLDDLAGMLGGGNQQAIADQGSSMLGSLLGDGVIGSLVGAVGKFSGLGGGSTKSLLGMLAPIVMSVLSKQVSSQGLDGGGLLGLISGQKDSIEKAMPSGMASALSGAGLMDSIMGTAQSATAAVGDAVDSAAGAAGRAAGAAATAAGQTAESVSRGASNVASQAGAAASDAASTGGSWMRWALPLLILLALIWLAFKFLGGGDVEEAAKDVSDAASSAVETTTEAASEAATAATEVVSDAAEATTEAASDAASAADDAVDATTEAASDAASAAGDAVDATTDAASDAASAAGDAASSAMETVTAMVGDVDVGGGLTSMFGDMGETLTGITDVESAKAAIPALEEMSTNLDSLTGLADQLPADAVGGVSEMVSTGLSGLDGVMEQLKAIPGVGELIEPIIATIKEKLAAFTAA